MDNPIAYIVRGGVLESAARPHHPFRQHNKKNALLSLKIINNDFVYHLSLYSTLHIAVSHISTMFGQDATSPSYLKPFEKF